MYHLYKSIWVTIISLFLQLLFSNTILNAQEIISLQGRVQDIQYQDLYLENIMIINLRTQQGIFAGNNNSFTINIERNDTLIISATGYSLKRVCFRDSVQSQGKVFTISMKRLSVQLKEVTIFQQREWKAIESDLQTLGYKESDYKLTGVEAWQSPVTALYQAFSRRERSKRKVAELMNDDLRKSLLMEIIHIYIKNKMIELSDDQMENFINFIALNDEALKNMSQYDLAIFIKDRASYYNSRLK